MSVMSNRNRKKFFEEENLATMNPIQVNKKLNFGLPDMEDDQVLQDLHQFDLELDSMETAMDLSDVLFQDKFSPCRTRSGRVYESGAKKRRLRLGSKRRKKTMRSRTHSGQSGTGSLADCSENESETSNTEYTEDLTMPVNTALARLDVCQTVAPPPLKQTKVPMSRLYQERPDHHDIPSSPISFMVEDRLSPIKNPSYGKWPREPRNLFFESPLNSPSPPTNTMKAMRLFDGLTSPSSACAISSPRSAPRVLPLKSRLVFDEDGEPRRSSFPGIGNQFNKKLFVECDSTSPAEKPKLANINPFTPTAMLAANRKRNTSRRSVDSSCSQSPITPQRDLPSLDLLSEPGSETEDEDRVSPLPTKRVRVSDIDITRYQEEFLELSEIASGEFGVVKQARHRLDGIVYAVKVTKKSLRMNSRDEKVAMNEVFAHAALIKHKNVVRYYNSWVEKGSVYIQNEFCEGGSLQKQIEEYRINGRRFSEPELRKITAHIAKGLQYIHSKQLVHLDVKPGNILIALENDVPSPGIILEHFTDSGAASGDFSPRTPKVDSSGPSSSESSPGEGEKVTYKIGDFGHVVPVHGGDISPEEGDCRYMAPEFLEMEVDRSKLTKADIFSLGLTIYEAASLRVLPKNSLDDANYENIKRGKLPYLKYYSEDFNNLITSMVHPDPAMRPTATRVLANTETNPGMNKSRSQLCKELKETREKLLMLEQELSTHKEKRVGKTRMVGLVKSTSCLT